MAQTLTGKRILIISPQSWGNMSLSKHHYAIELARKGNAVYFLNPPGEENTRGKAAISILPLRVAPDLWLIEHRIWFPYRLKFHALPLFHLLMKSHLSRVIKKIGGPVDVIWSFDLGNLYPFRLFSGRPVKIFHPVDEPLNQVAIDSGKGADIIFSVTKEILEKYNVFPAPGHFINHGVAEEFSAKVPVAWEKSFPIHVGLSGNWTRPDIDTASLLRIIREQPAVLFEFWGSYQVADSNIGGDNNPAIEKFIRELQYSSNVTLHGPIPSAQLAAELHRMDAFLICYDVQKDQSKGTNYHKVMEYLSTGKVIISNNITTYRDRPDLIQMIQERDNNEKLPDLFNAVISRIEQHNADSLREARVSYAIDNTYKKQLERIEALL
jgi:glycosyltransferase involved in cell wall biosynthesis